MVSKEDTVLYIGPSKSRCGTCNANVDISNVCTPIGYQDLPESCGAVYTMVISTYSGIDVSEIADQLGIDYLNLADRVKAAPLSEQLLE